MTDLTEFKANVGAAANDGTGDTVRAAWTKFNSFLDALKLVGSVPKDLTELKASLGDFEGGSFQALLDTANAQHSLYLDDQDDGVAIFLGMMNMAYRDVVPVDNAADLVDLANNWDVQYAGKSAFQKDTKQTYQWDGAAFTPFPIANTIEHVYAFTTPASPSGAWIIPNYAAMSASGLVIASLHIIVKHAGGESWIDAGDYFGTSDANNGLRWYSVGSTVNLTDIRPSSQGKSARISIKWIKADEIQ